ncbi:MAG TPA: carbohydrate ABC transporter permease [Symbiobacteriaceae bacterium]|nr:carbohydrate ABC transporter permease [Symbiobacteriaceae bacterium]
MTHRTSRLITNILRHLVLIAMSAFAILPFYWMVVTSIKPASEMMMGPTLIPKQITFEAYQHVWSETQFPAWFWNSLKVAVGSTALALLVACLAGYAMSRYNFRGKGIFGTTLLMVQMFPLVLVGIPLVLLISKIGVMDKPFGLVLIYMTFALPFAIWMMKGFFDGIPRSLEEAATIDGCSRMQAFRLIVLPLSGPGLTSVAVFTFLLAWNEFFIAYLFLKTRLTLPIGLLTFIAQFFNQWDSLMSAATLTTIPVLVFYLILQRQLTRGITAGAVKG